MREKPLTDTKLTRTIASTATLKIANIHSVDLFYTPLEERFERITRVARRALQVPVAAITLLNDEKQWFKSIAGWGVSELPRQHSICRFTVEENRLLLIPDTGTDPRTAENPIVTAAPRFRAYAGYPLVDQHGSTTGTFCVFGVQPREFTAADRQTIVDLAAMSQRELLSDHLTDAHSALTSKLSVARREAMMDPLTRLWNRRGASVLLKSSFASADHRNSPLTLALLDLDNFKRINDNYGHQIGDEVLRKVASRLIGTVRNNDMVCRIGGDEFLILMTETDAAAAGHIAERIRRAVTETPVPTRDGALPMSVSVGYTVRHPKDTAAVDELLERADQALLESKAAGRNRVRMTN
jgi:diguanylate cyclase (GGDEF)-like protein